MEYKEVIFGTKNESHLKHGVVSKPEYIKDEMCILSGVLE